MKELTVLADIIKRIAYQRLIFEHVVLGESEGVVFDKVKETRRVDEGCFFVSSTDEGLSLGERAVTRCIVDSFLASNFKEITDLPKKVTKILADFNPIYVEKFWRTELSEVDLGSAGRGSPIWDHGVVLVSLDNLGSDGDLSGIKVGRFGGRGMVVVDSWVWGKFVAGA